MLIMLLTLISTYMQNIIWILLVHNLFLAENVCKYTVRYAVRLPYNTGVAWTVHQGSDTGVAWTVYPMIQEWPGLCIL